MSELFSNLQTLQGSSQEDATELVGRLFDVAKPGVVFSEPITAEGRTVITASEVTIAVGIGFGIGGGTGTGTAEPEEGEEESEGGQVEGAGIGGGGGGGGGSSGRPVAVVIIEPAGVRVEPVVDATKLGLAALTTLGGIFAMAARMRRVGRR
jgi:uncharacterized spore protein YtfJ